MTGENFTRIDRKNNYINIMIEELQQLRDDWSRAYHDFDNDDYYTNLYKIEDRIKKLKFKLYVSYHSEVKGNRNFLKEFERKYLW